MAGVTIHTGKRAFQYIDYPNGYGNVTIPSGSVRADINVLGGGSAKTMTFTSADVSANLITFNHKLNKYPVYAIYNNNNAIIQPANATYIDKNNLQIDLTGYTISGTWTIALA